MAYNVRKLITEAYYLSNIVSREFQTIEGSQLELGFSLLNDFLALQSIDTQNIPYYTKYNLPMIVGQEKYNIPGLVDIESIDFYLGNVRIPMQQKTRKEYFYSGRVEGLTVMPFTCRIERVLGGADLWVYPLPNAAYDVFMMAKFSYDAVTGYDDDLSLAFDRFNIVYLRYSVAELICNHEGTSIPPNVADMLTKIRASLIETSYPDMSCSMISTLGSGFPDLVSAVVETSITGGYVP